MSVNYAVLVVEPELELRTWLTQRLLRRGYSVTAVDHPRQALVAAMAKDFCLAVVSSDLPEIDCPTLVTRLQRLAGELRSIVLVDDVTVPSLSDGVPLVHKAQPTHELEASLVAAISSRRATDLSAFATPSV